MNWDILFPVTSVIVTNGNILLKKTIVRRDNATATHDSQVSEQHVSNRLQANAQYCQCLAG